MDGHYHNHRPTFNRDSTFIGSIFVIDLLQYLRVPAPAPTEAPTFTPTPRLALPSTPTSSIAAISIPKTPAPQCESPNYTFKDPAPIRKADGATSIFSYLAWPSTQDGNPTSSAKPASRDAALATPLENSAVVPVQSKGAKKRARKRARVLSEQQQLQAEQQDPAKRQDPTDQPATKPVSDQAQQPPTQTQQKQHQQQQPVKCKKRKRTPPHRDAPPPTALKRIRISYEDLYPTPLSPSSAPSNPSSRSSTKPPTGTRKNERGTGGSETSNQTCFFWYHGHCARSQPGQRGCNMRHALPSSLTDPEAEAEGEGQEREVVVAPPGYVHRAPCNLPFCGGDGEPRGTDGTGKSGMTKGKGGKRSKRKSGGARGGRYFDDGGVGESDMEGQEGGGAECNGEAGAAKEEGVEEWFLEGFE